MKRIVLILPYFGKFREDFPFWLKSVEHNSTIDFFIFTDQLIENVPCNVTVYQTSLHEIEGLARKYVDEKCIIPTGYKLCDYKPAYGEIFKDYLKDYDFWGHCDCDLIFGDIRHFITDSILDNNDRILSRGHLTLYRNTPEVNAYYRRIVEPSYKEVYMTSKSYAFDEWAGSSMYWKKNNPGRMYDEIVFDDIAPYVYSFRSYQKNEKDKFKKKKNFIFIFDNGKLFRYYEHNKSVKKEETCYVHFQKRMLKRKCSLSNSFMMAPNYFLPIPDKIPLWRLRYLARTEKHWVWKERLLCKTDRILGRERKFPYLTLNDMQD